MLPVNIEKAIEGLAKVTLRGGVVGKVTFSVVAIAVVIGVVAWAAGNIWLSSVAVVRISLIAFVMLGRVIDFADRNPQAALLEGAEFLVHQQIVHAAKGMPTLPSPQLEPTQPEQIEGPSADPDLAQEPDQEVIVMDNKEGRK